MNLFIDNKSGAPIYEQLYTQIKNQILSGELQPEEAMPSIRGLARDLRISVITTKRAYEELERDGLILRREYLEVPVRVEYAPTEDCRRLLPILEQLSDWAEARMPADESTTKKEEPQ